MPIPKEILAVKRPTNTFVVAYGKNHDRYGVRKYIGCRNVEGRHLPKKGPTIGHIRNGVYISNEEDAMNQSDTIELKTWGDVMLCDKVFASIIPELEEFYSHEDALKLYCMAILRVCNPGIPDAALKDKYESSFLSTIHPNIALSRNTVCDFQKKLGQKCSHLIKFMRKRAEKICPNANILLDGTLKTDDSIVNTLSEFSRKARLKGSRDISVLYAYNLDTKEPVCSWCYKGNMLDVTAYQDFVSLCGVKRGVIVADKGFPASACEEYRKDHSGLHYLNPIKRNSKLIETHRMLDFTQALQTREGIMCKKAKVQGKQKWLYSFYDSDRAKSEEYAFIERLRKDAQTYEGDFNYDKRSMGTIVFECDLDLNIEKVYEMYENRWEVELVMRFYKSACEFDTTRVHSTYSVIGSEFCDFLATLLTFRLIRHFDQNDLLTKNTYARMMRVLSDVSKISQDGKNWEFVKMNPSVVETLQKLNLFPRRQEFPMRKRGRPPRVITG